jgi:hypothetical protein
MPVTSSDIVLFPGVRIGTGATDGGPPRWWPLPDGVANNLFADISAAQRTAGSTSVHKVFVGITNNDNDSLADAAAYISDNPGDADTDCLMFLFGGRDSMRAQTTEALYAQRPGETYPNDPFRAAGPVPDIGATITGGGGSATIAHGSGFTVAAGSILAVFTRNVGSAGFTTFGAVPQYERRLGTRCILLVTALGAATTISYTGFTFPARAISYTVLWGTDDFEVGDDGTPTYAHIVPKDYAASAIRTVGLASLTSAAAAAATTLQVSRVTAQLVPFNGTIPVPGYDNAELNGLNSTLAPFDGRVPIFRPQQQVIIFEGSTSEVRTVQRVGFDGTLTLTAGLTNSYTTAARVSALLPAGVTPQATGTVRFSQTAWTGVFGDTLIGTSAGAIYTGTVAVVNQGAATQKWAVVFSSTTAFTLYGDTIGEVGTGTTAADFSPLNSATGAPFFTLSAAGWGAPAAGHVLRFDTASATDLDSGMWVVRCVNSGSATFGADSVTVSVRGTSGGTVIGSCELPWSDGGAGAGGAGTPPPGGPPLVNPAPLPLLSPNGAIPALQTYRLTHTVEVFDDDTDDLLPVQRLRLGIDDGSVCWTLSAQGAEPLYAWAAESATPRVARVEIDGIVWRFVVEGVGRSRAIASSAVTITGRSIGMRAGEPYALPRNWVNQGATTGAQIATFAQETIGTSVVWAIEDWVVPDGVLTFAGSPLALTQFVAEAVGAQVLCDRATAQLYAMPRYPLLPEEWAAATPNVTIAAEAVRADAFERDDKPAYDSVYVSGQQQGYIGYVVKAGAPGTAQAPFTTHLLITGEPAARMRGRAILAAGGRQARETLALPVMTGAGQPGVLSPTQLVEVGGAWRGVVRAVNVAAELPRVEQTVVVERRL